MVMFIAIMQFFALLCFFLWWKAWSGKSTSWVEGRGWGWKPLFFLFGGVFFQGQVLGGLVFPFGGSEYVDSDVLRLLVVFMWFVACPVVLFGMFFWWPRFMLPGWVRERRRAGDPVKTAHPIPEVQHLMTKPQNTRLLSSWSGEAGQPQPTAPAGQGAKESVLSQPRDDSSTGGREPSGDRVGMPGLPVVFKVNTGGWWFGGIVGVISAVVLVAAVLGVPASVFEGSSGLMPLYRVLAVVGAPVAAVAGVYLLRGAARPEHVTVSAEAVSTRSWTLAWSEIEEIGVKGDPASNKGRVQLVVSDSAFAREGENNRWFSGRPLGMGGLVSKAPVIQLQPGLKTAPMHIAELIETVRTGLGVNQEGPRAGG